MFELKYEPTTTFFRMDLVYGLKQASKRDYEGPFKIKQISQAH